MPWRPSQDPTINRDATNSLWRRIAPDFLAAATLEPLPRHDPETRRRYVRERKDDPSNDPVAKAHLPAALHSEDLGPTDVTLLSFLLRQRQDRIANLVGPRGAGKTTLLHFAELALGKVATDSCSPQLLILNGLRLGRDATLTDWIALLRNELARSSTEPSALQPALQAGLGCLASTTASFEDVRLAAVTIVRSLPASDSLLLTIVFDNLDQLSPAAIASALELSRAIYLASGLGTIVCTRPGVRAELLREPAASAFFRFTLSVRPPLVRGWLGKLAKVLGAEFSRAPHSYAAAESTDVALQNLTGPALADALDRFAAALEGGKLTLVETLEAASADDTRHLLQLVRRLLSHRDLPVAYLLGQDSSLPAFAALKALLEGPRLLFSGDSEVPNLLYVQERHGTFDYLLPHHVLALLADPYRQVEVRCLLEWTAELGYEDADVRAFLAQALAAQVVGCSEGEAFPDAPEERAAAFLTSSGHYYLHHLLRSVAYVANAVVDVPLAHEHWRGGFRDTFLQRIASVLEYADAVCKAERRQLRVLAERPPSAHSRYVAGVFSRGGLLSAAILATLTEIVQSASSTRGEGLREILDGELARRVTQLETWLATAERVLDGLVRAGTERVPGWPSPPLQLSVSDPGWTVRVSQQRVGDDVAVHVDVSGGTTRQQGALVALEEVRGESPVRRIVPLPRSASSARGFSSKGNTWAIGVGRSVGPLGASLVPLPGHLSRVGVLAAIREHDECVSCTLHSFVIGESFVVGRYPANDWDECARKGLVDVEARVLSGKSPTEALRIAGRRLSRTIGGASKGDRVLGGMLGLLDTVLVFADTPMTPWEWLCPEPADGSALTALCEKWRMVRLPTADAIAGLVRVRAAHQDGGVGRLLTVGLTNDPLKPWRVKTPGSMEELARVARACDTLHLVGHWREGAFTTLDGSLEVTADGVDAFPLEVQNCVVSCCAGAKVSRSMNLPMAIASRSGCPTWAPMVAIRLEDAVAVDDVVADCSRTGPIVGVSHLVAERRTAVQVLWTYVRYGLNGRP